MKVTTQTGKNTLTSSSDVFITNLWTLDHVLNSFHPAFCPWCLPCCLWTMLPCLQTDGLVSLSFPSARPAKTSSVMDFLSPSASFKPLLKSWRDCCWVFVIFLLSFLSKGCPFRVGLGSRSILPWTSPPVLMWGVSGFWQESCGCHWDQRCCTLACCSSASSSWCRKCSIPAIPSVGWSSMPSLLSPRCCQVSVFLQIWNHSSRRASSST